jgi:hypothetical protein
MDRLSLSSGTSGTSDLQGTERSVTSVGRITGRAQFPKSWLQAAPGEVVEFASVSLIDPQDGKTLSGGRTKANGDFSLTPDGSLNLPPDSYYYLEVSKRLNASAIGSNVVAMRTVLKWTAAGWASITNASGGSGEIVVNPTTTAVLLLEHEDATIGFEEIVGKVSGAPSYTTVTAFGAHTPASVAARATEVSNLLAANQDPLGSAGLPQVAQGGNLAPLDLGDRAVHHDYVVKKGTVDSVFVWIPVFTAYQSLKSADKGIWVKDRPAGMEGVDWAQETFGGFYAGKYEASRSDATTTVGTSTTLKVAKGVVPWHTIDWDTAVQKCRDYDPNAYLMSDEEWMALAVWSMIHGVTVFGNNNSGNDADVGATTFMSGYDGANMGRALTGSGTNASWSGGVNLTTHTGKTDGVYDLNGNVQEWTSTLGISTTDGYQADEIALPVNGPFITTNAYVNALHTHPALRRYGVPGEVSTAQSSTFGKDRFYASSSNVKPTRGGLWNYGSKAGVWALDLLNARSNSAAYVGFRPVLRY